MQSIVYEQPVNELVRVCLRLAHSLAFSYQHAQGAQTTDTESAVQAIINILTLTDRPDLRGKFIKELMRQLANLQRFKQTTAIDQVKLQATLDEYERTLTQLQSQSGKFAMHLRRNEFLNNIRQHSSSGGGIGSFNLPAYHYWLQQPLSWRQKTIFNWLDELAELNQVVTFMQRLIRQSGALQTVVATNGCYQSNLDPHLPCQLVRVIVPSTLAAFPEISVGRHGVSIRFYQPTIEERGVAYQQDVSFQLSCCIL